MPAPTVILNLSSFDFQMNGRTLPWMFKEEGLASLI